MKINKIIMKFTVVSLIFLTACAIGDKDFEEAEWGMSVDQVIEIESENGNELYSETVGRDDGIEITFENMNLNGHEVDVEYVFNNRVEKLDVLTESQQEEFDGSDELFEKVLLKDYILIEGNYFFIDLNKDDSKEIYDSLVSKYGEPLSESDNGSSFWETERSLVYFSGDDYISYSATYNTLENFGK